jgi:hypothetical protein
MTQPSPEERREQSMESAPSTASSQAGAVTSPVDPLVACTNRLSVDPRFAQIARKLPLNGTDAVSFSMLANTTVPTPRERQELAAFFDEHDECWSASESRLRTQWPPEIFALVLESQSAAKDIGVDLYNGKITYGRANKRIEDLRTSATERLAPIVKHYQELIAAQKAADQEREERQRQAAADRAEHAREFAQVQSEREQEHADAVAAQEQALRQQRAALFLNYMQSVQRSLPPPPVIQPPISTNCYSSGNWTNCTSR